MKRVAMCFVFVVAALATVFSIGSQKVFAASFAFPVIGNTSYTNDYYAARADGTHQAIDIIANKGQKIVSVSDGTVVFAPSPEPSYGYMVTILSPGDRCYSYVHLNNDTPGTDDGKGGAMRAYAPDINSGNQVKKGQHIGWVGDSGNAESTVSHLHFEVTVAQNGRCNGTSGEHINPYNNLRNANHISEPVQYPQLANELLPFNTWYRSKLNVARGNLSGSSQDELVVGMGYGEEPKVRVFNSAKVQIAGFYAVASSAKYGVDVDVGDVDGDGRNEIVAGYRTLSSPKIAIFRINTDSADLKFTKVNEFTAFEGNTSPRVALGDINGDGRKEIIASKGRGSSAAVRTFDGDGNTLRTAFVVDRSFRGGLDIASGDVYGNTNEEIIVSALTDGSSFIRVFDKDFNKVGGKGFYSYNKSHRNGVYISAGNVTTATPKDEILTVPNGSYPELKYFNAVGDTLRSTHFHEEWWLGYYDVAAGNGDYSVATGGNRRGSIR